jgi:hypothetical protein
MVRGREVAVECVGEREPLDRWAADPAAAGDQRVDQSVVLKVLTKSYDVPVRDDAGREAEERFVDVVAAFPADAESFHAVVPGDRSFDHPPVDAQTGVVWLASSGDARTDALAPDRLAVLVVVVGAVGEQFVGSLSWPAAPPSNGWDLVDQWQQFGDVVAVAAGQ